MKTIYLAIIMATLALVGCAEKPTPKENDSESKENEPKYYAYNPEDTIDNMPYQQMLGIDSARAEYLFDRPLKPVPIEGINVDYDSVEQVFAEAEAAWYEMLAMSSQKRYEDMVSYYIKNENLVGIGLSTSTNKFELDYCVLSMLLVDQLDYKEAVKLLTKWLEFDKLLADGVVILSTSEGGSGFIPPQYAFQIEMLGKSYIVLGEKEKAEALIEPYRRALYLLSDDIVKNEGKVGLFKFEIYSKFGEPAKALETTEDYRDFLIQYATDTNQDYDEEIESFNKLIRELKNENE